MNLLIAHASPETFVMGLLIGTVISIVSIVWKKVK